MNDQRRVAYITGAARGQGRSHALVLADDGYDIVAVDLVAHMPTATYPSSTPEDLAETVRLVEERGRRCLAIKADVRVRAEQDAAVAQAVETFGRIDVALANAGILGPSVPIWEVTDEAWDQTISTNLSGVWQTIRAVAPTMIEQGSGAIVLTASTMGLGATPNLAAYMAAKHGVIGLMRSAATDLAPHGIRVTAVCPTTVNTEMIREPIEYFAPDHIENPTVEDAAHGFAGYNLIGPGYVEAEDISHAVRYLVSDAARYVTGIALPVDAGAGIMSVAAAAARQGAGAYGSN